MIGLLVMRLAWSIQEINARTRAGELRLVDAAGDDETSPSHASSHGVHIAVGHDHSRRSGSRHAVVYPLLHRAHDLRTAPVVRDGHYVARHRLQPHAVRDTHRRARDA